MKSPLAVALLLLVTLAPARAALTPAQLDTVAVSPLPGAHLDTALAAPDAQGRIRTLADVLGGRPAFVNFVDYTCTTLCGTDLALLAKALATSGIDGSRYRIVVIGIDPKDRAASARAMERKEIPPALWRQTTLLLPTAKAVERATASLGFHYVYDSSIDQFAHPAVIYVVGPDGALWKTLSPLALQGADLRKALASSAPRTGLFARVRLLCYAYDPATGVYTLRILRVLNVACIATVLMLVGAVLFLRLYRGRTT